MACFNPLLLLFSLSTSVDCPQAMKMKLCLHLQQGKTYNPRLLSEFPKALISSLSEQGSRSATIAENRISDEVHTNSKTLFSKVIGQHVQKLL